MELHSKMKEALCETAMKAARLAGQEALRAWRGPHAPRRKGHRDIVTEADIVAEKIIIDTILMDYPGHAILAEESGPSANGGEDSAGFQWRIDPIDGTTNYARGLPFFSVSVGVMRDGQPVAGAVYDPPRDQMYHATRGSGAFCDDRRLECSSRNRSIDFLIAFDWPRDEAYRSRLIQTMLARSSQIGSWRSLGSAALGIIMVAEGVADAYLHPTLLPWDVAAAGLIVEEAGGCVTDLDGSKDWWEEQACLASNGLAHNALLDMFHQILPDCDITDAWEQ